MHKTLIGKERIIRIPFFFIKTTVLGLVTSFFFFNSSLFYKICALVLIIVINALFLKTLAMRTIRFLLLSTVTISVFWLLFRFLPDVGGLQDALYALIQSYEYRNAIIRLWGMFLVGHLYLSVTSQYDILCSLKRINAGPNLSLFVVILFNAVAYFVRSYQDITWGFTARVSEKRKMKQIFYIMNSLVFDAISVIVECRKAFFLNSNRVYSSLGRIKNSFSIKNEVHDCLQYTFEGIKFPEEDMPVISCAEIELSKGVTLITGGNGSGKTTLLNLISGIIPNIVNADIGDIKLPEHLPKIGYVLQGNETAFFYDTVERALMHLPADTVNKWLCAFSMDYLLDGEHLLAELSAGETKIVLLLADLLDPSLDVCLLDEPSAFLSEPKKKYLRYLIQEAGMEKKILMATHDASMFCVADKNLSMKNGLLIDGKNPCSWDLNLKNKGRCGELLLQLTIPQPLMPVYRDDLQSAYDFVELNIHKSEVIAIIGENGAGKTTFGKYICFKVRDAEKKINAVMMRQELDKQFFTQTVFEELMIGTSYSEKSRKKAMDLLNRFGLEKIKDNAPQFLSGGEKRIVLTLALLMQEPDLIILDEPFDTLDENNANTIAQCIMEYLNETGSSCILIDQSIHQYVGIVDSVYHINAFRVEK